MSRIHKVSLLGLSVLALSWAPAMASAGDTHVTVKPTVLQTSSNGTGATVQTVRWGGGFYGGVGYRGGWGGGYRGGWGGGNRGWGGGYYGGGYGGYNRPYYGGYYSYPRAYYGYPGYYGGGYVYPNTGFYYTW